MSKKTTYCLYQPPSVPGGRDLDQGLCRGFGCSTLGVCWSDTPCWNWCVFKIGDYVLHAPHPPFSPHRLAQTCLSRMLSLRRQTSPGLEMWVPELSCWPCHRANHPPGLPESSATAVPATKAWTWLYLFLLLSVSTTKRDCDGLSVCSSMIKRVT